MSGSQFPLREKRKAATRHSLIQSAQALFAEQGYDTTTLEEVAEHAGLHVQTLYRHFANKQELATAGDQELLDRFRLAIRDPQRTNTTFDFWREWVRVAVNRVTKDDGGQQFRAFLLQRWTSPLVSSHLIRIGFEYEDLLTESLRKDFADHGDGVSTARLVACTLWGANSYTQREHASKLDFDVASQAVEVIDDIEAMFAHLLKSD